MYFLILCFLPGVLGLNQSALVADDSGKEVACFLTSGRQRACSENEDCSSWILYNSKSTFMHAHVPNCIEAASLLDKLQVETTSHVTMELQGSKMHVRVGTCIPVIDKIYYCIDGDVYARDCSDPQNSLERQPTSKCVLAQHDALAARVLWLPVLILTLGGFSLLAIIWFLSQKKSSK